MSEVKTSKIQDIISVRDYNGQHGTVYYFKILMENGETGEIGKKKQDALKVGDSLSYTSEESQFGLKFKEHKENGFNIGGRFPAQQRGGNESFALSYAKDIICSMIEANMLPEKVNSADISKATTAVANNFLEWMNEHKS